MTYSASLKRMQTNEEIWSQSWTFEWERFDDILDEIANVLFEELNSRVSDASNWPPIADPIAARLYLQARVLLDRFGTFKPGSAEGLLRRALEREPRDIRLLESNLPGRTFTRG